MSAAWSAEALERLDAAAELEIAVRRADGSLGRWTPIWVVRTEDRVHVRSWYRRDSGWFGRAVRTGRARVRVPGLEAEVVVDDVGDDDGPVRAGVDAAYRAKYRGGVEAMVNDAAAATTLRLRPGLSGSAGSAATSPR